MEQNDLPLHLTLRIDWSEQDLFGHINNVMYSKYVQAARVNLWDRVGLSQYYEQTHTGATLAATAIQFKKPLHYPGAVSIHSGIIQFKNTSFIIAHQLYNEHAELCDTAEDVVVVFDYRVNQKVILPGFIREAYDLLRIK